MFQFKKPVQARIEKTQSTLRIICATYNDETGKYYRRAISTGLRDSTENRVLLQRIVDTIKLDDRLDQFDETLNKYRPQHTGRGGGLILVSKLFEDFIEYKKPTLTKNSLVKYTNVLNIVRNYWSDMTCDAVAEDDVITLRNRLLLRLNPNTVREYFSRLSSCYVWAMSKKLVKSDPFKCVIPTVKPRPHKPMEYFEKEEVAKIFENADALIPEYAAFVKFLLLTGCRPGEAIALKWRDINLTTKAITIDESFDGESFKTTKTGKIRRFAMPDKLFEVMKKLHKKQRKDDLVFSIEGSPIDFQTFSRKFAKFLKKIDLPPLTPYSCRHTFITLCCRELGQSGIADIATMVGNSPTMIFEHYFHAAVNKEISFTF